MVPKSFFMLYIVGYSPHNTKKSQISLNWPLQIEKKNLYPWPRHISLVYLISHKLLLKIRILYSNVPEGIRCTPWFIFKKKRIYVAHFSKEKDSFYQKSGRKGFIKRKGFRLFWKFAKKRNEKKRISTHPKKLFQFCAPAS